MGSDPCSKGFLLFLLLQMSLPLCVTGESLSSTSGTDVTMVTSGSSFTDMGSSQMSSFTSATPAISASAYTSFTDSGANSTNSSSLFCRVLTCNCSMCYSTFMNANATLCSASARFCELRRESTMGYSVNCAATCPIFCNNTSQINCSLNCCGSEMCLNSSIYNLVNSSMMSMTTTMPAAMNTSTTKATTVVTSTTVTNGKKCNKISCTGDTCYQGNTNVMLCSTQNYCMLKKATSGTVVSWTGGCSDDCSKETACTSTTTTCFLECCNATTTASCLKLTGAVNMPSSAHRWLFSSFLLMFSSLFLWFISMAMSE